jgi:flagellar motility protein MotE (MotC chaperone)
MCRYKTCSGAKGVMHINLQKGSIAMRKIIFGLVVLILVGCETTYYNAWEKVGVHKRDLLVDRIEDTQSAQEKTQEQFKDALEQYRAVVNFDGGDLEKLYNKLNGEYEDSEKAAQAIGENISRVEDVAEDLFEEWEDELELIQNQALRKDSASKLHDTQYKYQQMITSMRKAEKTVHPVLTTLRDQVLYLKHNLNARAVAALKGELSNINSDVNKLIGDMQKSIDEANLFINRIKN